MKTSIVQGNESEVRFPKRSKIPLMSDTTKLYPMCLKLDLSFIRKNPALNAFPPTITSPRALTEIATLLFEFFEKENTFSTE
jgi:hypothetical protein